MSCKACRSNGQKALIAEVAIHFPEPDGINIPHVFVFPELLVCERCGFTEFTIPDEQLRELRAAA